MYALSRTGAVFGGGRRVSCVCSPVRFNTGTVLGPGFPALGPFVFFCAASLQRSLWKNSERSAMFYFREKGRSVLKAIRVCREVPEIGRTAQEEPANKLRQDKNCLSEFCG